jgi:hypothetical protein
MAERIVVHPALLLSEKDIDLAVGHMLHVYEFGMKRHSGNPLPPLSPEQLTNMMLIYDNKKLAISRLGLHVVDSHIIGRFLNSEIVKLQDEMEGEDEGY